MLYTVGEMAREIGVPASTLRYYDKEGILPFVERSSGGIRMFTEKDYEWMKVVECLRKSGLTLKEIRGYIEMIGRGDASLKERQELFLARKQAVERQMEELQDMLKLLEFKCWYYEEAIKDGTEERVRSLPAEQLPEPHKTTKQKMDLRSSRNSSLPHI